MMQFNWVKWLSGSNASPLRIGIDGLSTMVGGLDIGGLYLIGLENRDAQSLLLENTARAVLSQGQQCSILASNPEQLCNALSNSARQHNLNLLQWLPNVAQQLQTHGMRRFLHELEDLELNKTSLLLIGGGEDFLPLSNSKQLPSLLRELKRWLSAWQLTAVVFIRADNLDTLSDSVRESRRLLSGIAELSQDLGRYHWQVKYWHFAGGVVVDADYQVERDKHDDRLKIVRNLEYPTGKVSDGTVYYTLGAVAPSESRPEHWVACSDYRVMCENIEQMTSATVVLHYDRPESFILLAETVHRLRFEGGRQMRILVRERGSQLRYSQELLLNRLGANQVIYQEFFISRILRIVESSHGQTFSGYIEGDFQRALTEAMPSEECGYLPPVKFCEVVKNSLRKTEDVNMHHLLVRLDLLPQMAHLDVLLNCQPHRANDVVTADHTHVYIFLFACRAADIESALNRIITQPIADMFSGQSSWSGRWEILQILETLMDPNRMAALVDLSLVMPVVRRDTGKPTTSVPLKSQPEARGSATVCNTPSETETVVSKQARTVRRCVVNLKPSGLS